MAEKETKNHPKDLVEATPEEIEHLEESPDTETNPEPIEISPKKETETAKTLSWTPKTKLGKLVKEGKEKDIDEILKSGKKILESEIVDSLLEIESDLMLVGQAKGKFGGGKRRAWRQTQKKTREGNVLSFSAMAVVGDKKGHVGIGFGKARETLPAREKAIRNAKLSIIKILLGFESPEQENKQDAPHTVPFKVHGKCGSTEITLWPAPRGTGLAAGDECKKILRLAGIKDVYSQTKGKTKTTLNLARACISALEKTKRMKTE